MNPANGVAAFGLENNAEIAVMDKRKATSRLQAGNEPQADRVYVYHIRPKRCLLEQVDSSALYPD